MKVFISFSPHCLIPPSPYLFFLGEGVKDHASCHPQETNEEGKVISLGWVRMTLAGEGFDYFSQKRHEDGCSGHGEEIDPCHHSA